MEGFKSFMSVLPILAILSLVTFIPVYGQITTPCSPTMITSVTPCLNFITQSSGNGSSPTAGCCSSLKSLISSSMDCACLIITGSVPFQLPINRTLAISLPRACNLGGVPVQCKASGAPLPAPGPVSFLGPAPSPAALSPSSGSPTTSVVPGAVSPALAPESDPTLETPPATSETPSSLPGQKPALTPSSAAKLSHISFSSALLSVGVMVIMKFH